MQYNHRENEPYSILSYPVTFLFWMLVTMYSLISLTASGVSFIIRNLPKLILWVAVYTALFCLGLLIFSVAFSYIIIAIIATSNNMP